MSSDFRKNTRIYHKDLIDYKVFLAFEGSVTQGSLGNISETGLCAIMPTNFKAEQGLAVKGHLLYAPQSDKIDIEGRVAWVADYEHSGVSQLMLGVEFSSPLPFPEHLMALSMSFEG